MKCMCINRSATLLLWKNTQEEYMTKIIVQGLFFNPFWPKEICRIM